MVISEFSRTCLFKVCALFVTALNLQNIAFSEGLQFQCGPSEGKVFNINGGWHDDQIPEGEMIIRLRFEDLSIDYQFKDSSGTWESAQNSGAELQLISILESGSFMFSSIWRSSFGESVELITITELNADKGSATAVLTGARNTTLVTNSKVLKSSCQITAF